MAKAKNYNNYAEIVGNVANIFQTPTEKNGDMRCDVAVHRKFTKKDGTKGKDVDYYPVLVKPGRKFAKQEAIVKGNFIRVIGHHEDNRYKAEDGTWKGSVEICADKIVILKERGNGKVENTETGEVETITEEALDIMDTEE